MLDRRTKFDLRTGVMCAAIIAAFFACKWVYSQGTESTPPAATEKPAATTPDAAASTPTTPPEPQPDPSGLATGDKTSVADAGGNSYVVAEPTDKTDPDYAKKKADFDEYTAAAAKEPLTTKLADSVGHLKIATNTSWTLNTGYLVLFMQAGFALLTCGLVRKKNAAHLMMLNFAAYVFAFLAYWAVGFAFQWGGVGGTAWHRRTSVGHPR